jgi:hypothetical protein
MRTDEINEREGAYYPPATRSDVSQAVHDLVTSIALQLHLEELEQTPRVAALVSRIVRANDDGFTLVCGTPPIPWWWWWHRPRFTPPPPPPPIDPFAFASELAYVAETMQKGRLRDATNTALRNVLSILTS